MKNYKFIESSTHDIEIDETDLLFIDTEHHYDCLSVELALHADKARKYLVFHDTDEKNTGVRQAINEFMKENIFTENQEWWMEKSNEEKNNIQTIVQIKQL